MPPYVVAVNRRPQENEVLWPAVRTWSPGSRCSVPKHGPLSYRTHALYEKLRIIMHEIVASEAAGTCRKSHICYSLASHRNPQRPFHKPFPVNSTQLIRNRQYQYSRLTVDGFKSRGCGRLGNEAGRAERYLFGGFGVRLAVHIYGYAPGHTLQELGGQQNHLGAAAVALNENLQASESQQVSIGSMEHWSVYTAELMAIFYAISLVLQVTPEEAKPVRQSGTSRNQSKRQHVSTTSDS
ncbi:hypothetical protein CBS147353_11478 [Aspergillus niger]|nr:hypothetical protein CBS147353_11478 [Aspergillus niger]